MPFKLTKSTVTAEESCTVEDAMPLLEHLIIHPAAKIDLRRCTSLHSAVLQVLLAAKPKAVALPHEAFLARWMGPLFAKAGK